MTNVVDLQGNQVGVVSADDILESAKGNLETVVVLGTTANGQSFIQSNQRSIAELNYIIDIGKRDLFELAEGNE